MEAEGSSGGGGEGVRGDLCATIAALPSQLGAEDVEDFFSLAQYYASRSPQSFRKVGTELHQCVEELEFLVELHV